MSVDTEIYDAFTEHLAALSATLPTASAVPVAYPGIHFTPPDEGIWLELSWFPNRTVPYGVGNEGPNLHQGFGQVSVCGRPGAGISKLMEISDMVIEWFAKGTALGPAKVDEKPWKSSVLDADDRTVIPTTIRYRGLISD